MLLKNNYYILRQISKFSFLFLLALNFNLAFHPKLQQNIFISEIVMSNINTFCNLFFVKLYFFNINVRF